MYCHDDFGYHNSRITPMPSPQLILPLLPFITWQKQVTQLAGRPLEQFKMGAGETGFNHWQQEQVQIMANTDTT
jgi:hypothetical protein